MASPERAICAVSTFSGVGVEVSLMSVFTLGVWTVQEGREDDFVRAWRDLAERTKEDFSDATATLLRDREQPNRFVSSGPWESLDQIEQWRNSNTFQAGVGKIRELLDDFSPSTLDVAANIR
jgi:heme-degrading monooxygenase HmoA